MTLRYGHPAPDFALPSTLGRTVTLGEFRGQADVVLTFFCFAWGGIWTPELADLGRVAEGLRERGAVLLAISGDSTACQAEFTRARNFSFPLLSDVHRTVIRAYGVLDEERNVAYRSTFIVDRDGRLRWGQTGDRLMTRDGAEILRVLDLVDRLRRGR